MKGIQIMKWGLIFSTFFIVSCGGGGGGDDGGGDEIQEPEPTVYSLSGRITADTNIAVDGDINDPFAPYTSNDDISDAQTLSNPVMVNGFISKTGTGGSGDRFELIGDESDWFRTELYAGQFVSLRVTEFDDLNPGLFDIDVWLYDANLNIVASSISVTEFESIQVPADGEYYIEVEAWKGTSKYVLGIGSVSLASGTAVYGLSADFVPGQAIIKQASQTMAGSGVQPLNQLQEFHLSHDRKDRAALLSLMLETSLSQAASLLGAGPIEKNSGKSRDEKIPLETLRKIETLRLIKQLNARPDIEYAEPNFIVETKLVPNDSYYDFQEHYPQIRLPQAWDVSTGTPDSGSVVVAVVDTGVVLAHEDFDGQLLAGYDFISDPTISNDGDGIDNNPDDPGDSTELGQSSWHGTHVAGTIAAASNNSQGVAGVAWGAKVMPVRVLGVGGGTTYDVDQGVRYAAGLTNDSGEVPVKAADIINLSLGGGGYLQSSQDTFTSAYNAGVIVIAAAGNENTSVPAYPASYDGVTSVSATDWQNIKAYYSNYGTTVDVAAPGGDVTVDRNGDSYGDGVLSCIVDDTDGTRVTNYAFYQGTSMASPHVAGVAALMKAIYPELTPSEFDFLLADGRLTNDLGDPGRDDIYGHGMLDALKAVEAAQELAGGTLPDTVIATPTSVDFESSVSVASVMLSGFGDNPPAVVGVNDDAKWLEVSAGSVDANGLGDYTLTVDRTGLVDASYSATMQFSLSDGMILEVAVSMRVQTVTLQPGDAGYLYIILFDPELNYQTHLSMMATDAVYDFQFDDIPAGEYYLIAGSDVDNNGTICEIGETCGAYPLRFQELLVTLNQNISGLDFPATINSGLSGTTVINSLSTQQGFRVEK